LSEIKVDPGFATFVRECDRNGIGMTVVSDGFDFVIERVLSNAGHRNLQFYANHLVPTENDGWRVTFPFSRSDCRVLAGNCKCSFTTPHSSSMKVVVGDGRSDFCVAGEADLVFAKGTLLKLCQSQGTAHYAFDDFFSVTKQLNSWLRSGYDNVGEMGERVAAQHRG